MAEIVAKDVQDMVRHWLATPVHGYLGSDYGQDAKSLLQRPLAAGDADGFIQKLRDDVPVLQIMPSGALNLYAVTAPPDRADLFIEVAGDAIHIQAT